MWSLTIRKFIPDEAKRASLWSYEPPFDIYNGDPDDADMFLSRSPEGYGYYAIVDQVDDFVGFCCFGPEARVTGQVEEPGTLDIGGGVRPDLVSQHVATEVFPALLKFAAGRWSPDRFRTAVATFNDRSTRLCLSAGFVAVRTFDGPGRKFQELVRPG
jgi:ribosomal-protein-alanine N-acetyltransferase